MIKKMLLLLALLVSTVLIAAPAGAAPEDESAIGSSNPQAEPEPESPGGEESEPA